MIRFIAAFMCWVVPVMGQLAVAPAIPEPDERYKADILLIVAHPDDETALGSFLAKMVFDENRRIGVIYLNRGNGGGNSIGNEQSMALANIREIEVRRALAEFGIFNAWILDGEDTPGQDLFQSLHKARHGESLEKMVRIIRLTRPEIIITWMPVFVAGENHGDHQASGVIATEAFDLAGDPTVFATQVTYPRDRLDINNFQEGLKPWQAKKLYYFSDRDDPMPGAGPAFDIDQISKTRSVPYYELGALLHLPHLVQGEVAQVAIAARQSGDYTEFRRWLSKYRLILGKSHVMCKPQDDIFYGITSESLGFKRPAALQPEKTRGISIRPGGVFEFYRQFCQAHDVGHISDLIKPEIMIAEGSYLHFPLIIDNNTDKPLMAELQVKTPEGWQPYTRDASYELAVGESYPVQTMIQAPYRITDTPEKIIWKLTSGGKELDSVELTVHLREWTLPQ